VTRNIPHDHHPFPVRKTRTIGQILEGNGVHAAVRLKANVGYFPIIRAPSQPANPPLLDPLVNISDLHADRNADEESAKCIFSKYIPGILQEAPINFCPAGNLSVAESRLVSRRWGAWRKAVGWGEEPLTCAGTIICRDPTGVINGIWLVWRRGRSLYCCLHHRILLV
jgi:hypothetical protein